MPRSVRLSTASDIIDLVDLVQVFAMNSRTGRLRIRYGDETRTLVLLNGAIAAFEGPDPPGAPRAGADPTLTGAWRRHRVVERFLEVLVWPEPDLEFTELEPGDVAVDAPDGEGPLSVQGTLLEVLQMRDLLERTATFIPDLESILVVAAGRREAYDGSPYASVLARLDGRHSVAEAIEAFGLEKYQALERLATLVKQKDVVPVDPLQLEMLAWEHESAGHYEPALRVYRLLRRRAPENLQILKNVAGVLAHLGRMQESAAVLAEYAGARLRDGVTEEALRTLRLAIRFDPGAISLRERYVDALSREGAPEEVVEEYLVLADRYLAVDDHMLAKNALRRILRVAPDHGGARRRLADLCRALGEEGATVSELTQLAAQHRAAGEIEEAMATCREALELDAGCVEARLLLAELLLDRGEAEPAQKEIAALEGTLRAVGAVAPDELPAQVGALLERVIEIRPDHAETLERLAIEAGRTGREARAVDLESRLVQVLAGSDDLPGAIRVLERLIHRLPDAIEHHARLADLYVRVGETMRAAAIYEFAGEGLLAEGRFDDAALVFGKLLEIDPGSSDASLGFARSLRGRGETHRALLRYREAARMLDEAGQPADAVAVREEALECDPGDVECVLAAASHHERQGHRRRAIHIYLAALKVARERGDDRAAEQFQRLVLELEPGNAIALGGSRG